MLCRYQLIVIALDIYDLPNSRLVTNVSSSYLILLILKGMNNYDFCILGSKVQVNVQIFIILF